MSSTRQNGIVTITNDENYDLANHLARMADSANVVVQVVNNAALLALTPFAGMVAVQLDTGALWLYTSGSWGPFVSTKPFGHLGKTNGFQSMSTAGVIVMGTAQDLSGGMTVDAGTSSLVAPIAGRYRASMNVYTTGGGGVMNANFQKNGASAGVQLRYFNNTNDLTGFVSSVLTLSAGDKINIWCSFPFSTYGSTGYNGTYLELEYLGAV